MINPCEKIENEAFEMVHKYGKYNAYLRCSDTINEYRDKINKLKYYDTRKVNKWMQDIFYWEAVDLAINNI